MATISGRGIGGREMYKLSRYWNRIAYFILRLGQRMIWDYTGKNKALLTNYEVASRFSEDVLCDK